MGKIFSKNRGPESDFQSETEVTYFLKHRGKTIFPVAYSFLCDNADFTKKYNLISKFDSSKMIVSPINGSDYRSYDISSELERNLLFKGGIDISGGFKEDFLGIFKINFNAMSENSLNYNCRGYEKTYKKIITEKIAKAKIRIPIEAIKIKPNIENQIEKILFGYENSSLPKEEKYDRMCDYLKDYGEIIPTAVTIGAKYKYLLESSDRKLLEEIDAETRSHLGYGNSLDIKNVSDEKPKGNNSITSGKDFNFKLNSLYQNKNENAISDVKVDIISNGSSLINPTIEQWMKSLNRNYYDIVDVEESYDIIKFLSPSLRSRVEDLFIGLDAKKIKIKRLIKMLTGSGYSSNSFNISSESSYDHGICDFKSQWQIGATPEFLKVMGIPYDVKPYKKCRTIF